MPTATECVCCIEIDEVSNKMSAEGISCITFHPGFKSVCLDIWVLQTAFYSFHQKYGDNAFEGMINDLVMPHKINVNL